MVFKPKLSCCRVHLRDVCNALGRTSWKLFLNWSYNHYLQPLCFTFIPDYATNHIRKEKKKLAAPDISLTLDRSEGSVLSDELDESTELDLDEMDTPSDNSNEFEWEGKNFFYILKWNTNANMSDTHYI